MATEKLLNRPYKSRVRRPREKADLLNELVTSSGATFATLRDCLVFAAAFGSMMKARRPFDATDEQIPWSYFENYEALIHLLALAESGDSDIVAESRFGEQLTIFEELANGGLEEIARRLAMFPDRNQISALHGAVVTALAADSDAKDGPDVAALLRRLSGAG